MSVVKKLQQGGSAESIITNKTFEDFLDEKLETTNFTTKALSAAQNAAKRFRDLHKSDNFKDIYSYDKLTNTYTINEDKLSGDLKNNIWSGSKDAISKNIFGQYTAKADKSSKGSPYGEDEKFNTLAASWMNEYIESTKGNSSKGNTLQEKNRETKQIPSLAYHTVLTKFGGNESTFRNRWNSMDDLEEKKKLILESATSNVDQYINAYEKNKDRFDYKDIDKIKALKQSITSGDWKQFETKAEELGWDPVSLLSEPKDETEDPAIVQRNAIDSFKEAGITDPTLIGNLMNSGFNKITSEYDPSGKGWLPNYLKDQGAITVQDEHGNTRIYKDGLPFDKSMIDPTNSDSYGHYWEHDNQGNVKYHSPQDKNYDLDRFSDPLGGGYGFRFINAKLSGQYKNWDIKGWTSYDDKGEVIRDILGQADYTKHITLSNPASPDDTPLEFKWDTDKYISESGQTFEDLDISGYGNYERVNIDNLLKDSYEPLGKGVQYFDTFDAVSKAADEAGDYGSGYRNTSSNNYKKILSDLRYKIHNTESSVDRDKALDLYNEIKEALPGDVAKEILDAEIKTAKKPAISIADYNLSKPLPYSNYGNRIHKAGGKIIKAQNGTALNTYQEKYGSPKVAEEKKQPRKIKDIRGTIKDMDALDAISLAGAAASFVPVVGAIGGAVTTVADAIKGAEDGWQWKDTGNLLLNVGFTGLGLVGLGGLKGLQLASKVAKVADKTLDIGMASKKAIKFAKVAGSSEDALQLVKSTGNLERAAKILGEETIENFVKRASKVDDLTSLGKADQAVLKEFGMKISGGKIITPKGFIKKEAVFTSIGDDISNALKAQTINTKNLAQTLSSDVGKSLSKIPGSKYIPKAAMATMGVSAGLPAVGNVVKNVKEDGLWEGIGNTKVSDVKNLMFLGSTGRGAVRDLRKVKAINKYTKPISSTPDTYKLTIGDKTLTLNSKVDIPSEKSLYKRITSGKIKKEELSKEALLKFKKDLREAGASSADLKGISTSLKKSKGKTSIDLNKGVDSGRILDPAGATENLSEFALAKKSLESGMSPTYSPKIWRFIPAKKQKVEELRNRLVNIDKLMLKKAAGKELEALKAEQSVIYSKLADIQKFQIGGTFTSPLLYIDHKTPIKKKKSFVDYDSESYMNKILNGVGIKTPDQPPLLPKDNYIEQVNVTGQSNLAPTTIKTPKVSVNKKAIIPTITRPQSVVPMNYLKKNPLTQIASMPPAFPELVGLGNSSDGYAEGKKTTTNKEGNGKLGNFLDPNLIANITGFANTIRTNNASAKSMKKAAIAGLVRPNTVSRRFYRTNTPYNQLYNEAADKTRGKAGRIAEGISDINASLATQLEGERMAQQTELEGKKLGFEDVKQQRAQQEQSDAAIDQVNNQIVNQYKQSAAGAERSMHLVDSNKILANNQAFQNLLRGTTDNIQKSIQKNNQKALMDFSESDDYKNTVKAYNDARNAEATEKAKWKAWQATAEGQNSLNQEWKQSTYYNNWKPTFDVAKTNFDENVKKYNALRNKSYLSYSSGGTLSEKESLEKLKQYHKKELIYEKQLYKLISNGNKLMQKSLIKIFK